MCLAMFVWMCGCLCLCLSATKNRKLMLVFVYSVYGYLFLGVYRNVYVSGIVCMCMFTFMRMCMFQWVCIRCWGGNVPFRSYLNVPFRPPYRGEGRVETGHYHPERWARTRTLPPVILMEAGQHNSFDSLRSIRASVRSSAIRSSEGGAVLRLFVRLIVCSSVRPRKRLC